ncbi:MAG: hypothetical protein ACR2QO_03765 [Acidimicrobiales bacterium]
MNVIWGTVVVALSLLAWAGQTLSWLAPSTAVRLQLMEAEDEVDPTFWADIRAEALWDAVTLWVMAAAGVLLIADVAEWPYFGLVGGGIYLYFGGRGISTRITMTRLGIRIGTPESVRTGVIFLVLWGVMALITIAAAIVALES